MKSTKPKPYVIGISSVSGGGKTTVTRALKEKLPNSFAIFFDDFDACDDPTVHPKDLYQWALDGGDQNAWQTPGIIAKMDSLKKNQEYDFVVFDAPLGRAHEDSGRFIDLMVFIDTPLDVAMARRLIRDYLSDGHDNSEQRMQSLGEELSHYLEKARLPYLEMGKGVKPKSDMVLDGCLTPTALVDKIIEKINAEQGVQAAAVTLCRDAELQL